MFSSIAPGSGVAVVAPAGPASAQSYARGLDIVAARYRIVHAYAGRDGAAPLPYLAGDDDARVRELQRCLDDPEVEAILCARGGYGSSRILDRVDARRLGRRPLVGFSDITALHAWAASAGHASIHGPGVNQLSALPASDVDALWGVLEGEAPRVTGLSPLVGGRARGPIFGGNLSLLAHLVGTRHLPTLTGRIVLLEEVGEAPYRIDRLLTQLRVGANLFSAAGIVVGDLTNCGRPEERAVLEAVLRDRLSDLGVPVAVGAPIGHGARNVAVPFGVPAMLDADAGTLVFPQIGKTV